MNGFWLMHWFSRQCYNGIEPILQILKCCWQTLRHEDFVNPFLYRNYTESRSHDLKSDSVAKACTPSQKCTKTWDFFKTFFGVHSLPFNTMTSWWHVTDCALLHLFADQTSCNIVDLFESQPELRFTMLLRMYKRPPCFYFLASLQLLNIQPILSLVRIWARRQLCCIVIEVTTIWRGSLPVNIFIIYLLVFPLNLPQRLPPL